MQSRKYWTKFCVMGALTKLKMLPLAEGFGTTILRLTFHKDRLQLFDVLLVKPL